MPTTLPNTHTEDELKTYHEYIRHRGWKNDSAKTRNGQDVEIKDALWKAEMGVLQMILGGSKTTQKAMKPFVTFIDFVRNMFKTAERTNMLSGMQDDAEKVFMKFLQENPKYMKDHLKEYPELKPQYEAYVEGRSKAPEVASTNEMSLANSAPIGPQGALKEQWNAGKAAKTGITIHEEIIASVKGPGGPSLEAAPL